MHIVKEFSILPVLGIQELALPKGARIIHIHPVKSEAKSNILLFAVFREGQQQYPETRYFEITTTAKTLKGVYKKHLGTFLGDRDRYFFHVFEVYK